MSGIERIAKERQRQIEAEGWTPEHDDGHDNGSLIRAAAMYLGAADGAITDDMLRFWPWSMDWWKPSDDPMRNLEKAGALIAAEIDRLERAAQQENET